MPEIPRDPRQLARDILSGKVRIEDLARERQMRQGQVPAKIPLPRPPAPAPPSPMRARPPQQRQMPRQFPSPTGRAPAPRQQPGRPVLTVPPPVQRMPQMPSIAETPAAPSEMPPRPPLKRALRIGALVRSRLALRQGIILSEILGKPVALRELDGGS